MEDFPLITTAFRGQNHPLTDVLNRYACLPSVASGRHFAMLSGNKGYAGPDIVTENPSSLGLQDRHASPMLLHPSNCPRISDDGAC